jgi:PAP2 superfamily
MTSATVVPLRARESAPGLLRRVWREHRWFVAAVAVYLFAALALLRSAGLGQRLSLSIYKATVPWLLVGYFLAFLLGYGFWVLYIKRPPRLWEFLRTHLFGHCLHPERLLRGGLVVLGITVALSVYTSVKSVIPAFAPFHLDAALAQLDAWVHGGRQPWELLQPLLGTPAITAAVGASYHLWFVAVYVVLFWQAFSRHDPELRMQFLLTFVLVWALLGNLAAMLLSSAGPCYYQAVTALPDDPFAPLLAYLRGVDRIEPLLALKLQAKLWASYLNGGVGFGSGISAMPSIHNAMVWLLVFVGWRTHRLLGAALALFALLVFLGSVHLAWHYAIDAYVAVACTWLLWWLAGKFVRYSAAARS